MLPQAIMTMKNIFAGVLASREIELNTKVNQKEFYAQTNHVTLTIVLINIMHIILKAVENLKTIHIAIDVIGNNCIQVKFDVPGVDRINWPDYIDSDSNGCFYILDNKKFMEILATSSYKLIKNPNESKYGSVILKIKSKKIGHQDDKKVIKIMDYQ